MKRKVTVTLDDGIWREFQEKTRKMGVSYSTALDLILMRVVRSGNRLEDWLEEARGTDTKK